MSRRPWALGLALLLAAVAERPARAQTPDDRALAEALFRDAKRLMAEGSFAPACIKLAESQRLDPGGGTLLNLAVCHEGEGKTSTAFIEFGDALAEARRDGRPEREDLARTRLAALKERLSWLTVKVDPRAAAPGFELRRDGAVVGPLAWSTPTPLDPGRYVISATAPGKRLWSTTVALRPDGDRPVVIVPVLEDAPPPRAPPTAASEPPRGPRAEPPVPAPARARRTAGFTVGGLGAVGIVVGAAFGVSAIVKRQEADAHCGPTTCRDEAGVSLDRAAKTAAVGADIATSIGVAALAVGTVLVFTGRAPGPAKAARALQALPGGRLAWTF